MTWLGYRPPSFGEEGRFEATDVKIVVVKWLVRELVVIGVGARCMCVIAVRDNLFYTFALQQESVNAHR